MGSIATTLQTVTAERHRTGYACSLFVRLAGADDDDRDQVSRILHGESEWSSRIASRILSDALGISISDQMVRRHRNGVCRTCSDG